MKTVEAELRRRGERERNAIFFLEKKRPRVVDATTANHPQTMTTQGPKVKTVFRDE